MSENRDEILVDAIVRTARPTVKALVSTMRAYFAQERDDSQTWARGANPAYRPIDVTEEPPVGSQVTDSRGQVHERTTDGWREWYPSDAIWGSAWPWEVARGYAPPRLTTDADRERVGLTVDTAPDVDPDEALAEAEGRIADLECRVKRAEAQMAEPDDSDDDAQVWECCNGIGGHKTGCQYDDGDPDEPVYRIVHHTMMAPPYDPEPTRCCTGECCGPGSWCCMRAGEHDHDPDEAQQEDAVTYERERAEEAEAERDEWREVAARYEDGRDKWQAKFEQTDDLLSRTRDERVEQTRDAIEWRNRYEALRADVEAHGPFGFPIGECVAILNRDDERAKGEQR